MTKATPFTIAIPQTRIDAIMARIEGYQFYPAPVDDNWQYGMKTSVLKDVRDHWLNTYDWRKAEADLNKFPQFRAEVDGMELHFIHVVGEAKGKRPLLITHGWPGSVFEFWQSIEPLAYPSRFGGKVEDAFDLVIPSLPGYGFSGKPEKPMGQKATAKLFNKLMQDVLGYQTYLAQGGDWGSVVTSWIGFNHCTSKGGGCTAIHLNMVGLRPEPATPQTDEEIKWIQYSQARQQVEGTYLMQQAMKPQSLAIGMMDSPMGQAAWILEKFHGWSDLQDGDLTSIYSYDQLITNLMIYLVNDAFATSIWYYNGLFAEGGNALPSGERVEIPVGYASFPGDTVYSAPPRSWFERMYNCVHWTEMTKGGHFAAMEQPDLFVADVRKWAANL